MLNHGGQLQLLLQVTWLVITKVQSESFGLVTERRHYNAHHIFHRRAWYRALSLLYACTRNSGIILIPRLHLCQILFLLQAPIAELARVLTHAITHSVTQLIWCSENWSFRFGKRS